MSVSQSLAQICGIRSLQFLSSFLRNRKYFVFLINP